MRYKKISAVNDLTERLADKIMLLPVVLMPVMFVLSFQPTYGQSTVHQASRTTTPPGATSEAKQTTRLYEPRGVKAAYAAGTRSRNGKPGPHYWQNHGQYKITITAKPPDRMIRGSEHIVYRNESSKPMALLIVKLFMNVHQQGAPRSSGVPPGYLTSGIQIDSFAVNGQARPWQQLLPTFTWQPIRLAKPLAPTTRWSLHSSGIIN